MATAPFQLWMEMAPIASAVRVGSTVTITTTAAHNVTTGGYIQIEAATGSVGTSLNGVYQATVTSGTTFTYTAAGTAGTAVVTAAALSYDLLTPLIDYAAANRQAALYVSPESITMSAVGDGTGSSCSFTVMQDQTPAAGPWFNTIPDETRIRLVKANTGTNPASTDVYFLGSLRAISSRFNGSGLGTITDVEMVDPTSHLERIVVYGNPLAGKIIASGGLVRSSNVVTVTTSAKHGFTAGQKISILGANGGSGTSFGGAFTIATVPSTTTFTYAQTGSNSTGGTAVVPSAAAFDTNSRQRITYTVGSNHGFGKSDIKIAGVTHSNSTVNVLVNGIFQIKATTATTISVDLPVQVSAPFTSFTLTNATITPIAVARIPSNAPGAPRFRIAAGVTDAYAVQQILATVDAYKFNDYAFQRILNTSDTSAIVGSSTTLSRRELLFPIDTLGAALDSVVELYNATDGKSRRYWINNAGQLEFRLVDATAAPAYADAPYKISTTGTVSPNAITTPAVIAPSNLEVSYDHETTKNIILSTPAPTQQDVETVYTRSYIDAGYAARGNGPQFDAIVEAPSTPSINNAFFDLVQEAASTYLQERRAPVLSASFELIGAGTASHNNLGFSAGYAFSNLGTISTASRTGSTVTITMATAHGLASGAQVVIAGITGAAGTTMNGTFTCTVTTTTAFTYTAAGTAGSGTVTTATAFGAKLISRWMPGQWVDVSAGTMLSGLYRVEQVETTLSPGSFLQRIRITINRTPARSITKILAKKMRKYA